MRDFGSTGYRSGITGCAGKSEMRSGMTSRPGPFNAVHSTPGDELGHWDELSPPPPACPDLFLRRRRSLRACERDYDSGLIPRQPVHSLERMLPSRDVTLRDRDARSKLYTCRLVSPCANTQGDDQQCELENHQCCETARVTRDNPV